MSMKVAVSALLVCGTSSAASAGCYIYNSKYSVPQGSSESADTGQEPTKGPEELAPAENIVPQQNKDGPQLSTPAEVHDNSRVEAPGPKVEEIVTPPQEKEPGPVELPSSEDTPRAQEVDDTDVSTPVIGAGEKGSPSPDGEGKADQEEAEEEEGEQGVEEHGSARETDDPKKPDATDPESEKASGGLLSGFRSYVSSIGGYFGSSSK